MDAFSDTLECIEINLGLKVSDDKTILYRVGSLQNSNAKLFVKCDFKWSNEPIETLGVHICCDGSPDVANFEEVLCKMKAVSAAWHNRKLTIVGKVTVFNTLMASLFLYKMLTMLNLNRTQLDTIDKVTRDFLWRDKEAKIALTMLHKKKEQGGLKLADPNAKQKVLKIAWIFKIEKDTMLTEIMYKHLAPTLRQLIWHCNLQCKDVHKLYKNSFWKEVLLAWAEINAYQPQGKAVVLEQVLWLTSHIRINNRPVCWNHWIDKGLLMIEDLINDNGRLTSCDTLGVNWLELQQIYQAIPPYWKLLLRDEIRGEESSNLYKQLAKSNTVSRDAYNLLINDDNNFVKYGHRWVHMGLNVDFVKYQQAFQDLHIVIKSSKLRSFQYRLLLNKITTNCDLKEWKLRESDSCTFCNIPRQFFIYFIIAHLHNQL